MSWDDEWDRIVLPLMPEIEAAESCLGSMPLVPEPRGRGEGRVPSAKPATQIEVVTDLLLDLRPDLDPSLHRIVEAYHRYWREGADDLSLDEINAMRAQFPRDHPSFMQMVATQYLMGEGPWMTVQDGPVLSMALDLRLGGVPEERVRAALTRLVSGHKAEHHSESRPRVHNS